MGKAIKYIFWVFVGCCVMGYCAQGIKVSPPEERTVSPNLRNAPPDPNREVIDYDWNNTMYIYQDMVGTYIEYANNWYHKDSLPEDYFRTKRSDKPKPMPMEIGDYELEQEGYEEH